MIKTEGQLFDYLYNYIEKYYNSIDDLRSEFESMWPMVVDLFDDTIFSISKEDGFRKFQHAFGIVNSDKK